MSPFSKRVKGDFSCVSWSHEISCFPTPVEGGWQNVHHGMERLPTHPATSPEFSGEEFLKGGVIPNG